MLTRRDMLKLSTAGAVTASMIQPEPDAAVALAQDAEGAVAMFRGNAARTGEMPGPAPTLELPVYVKWRFKTGDSVTGSPAVHNGVVYIGSQDGIFYAIDAVTGQEIWRFVTDAPIRTSPAISGSTVVIGNSMGEVYALETSTGDRLWTFSMEPGTYGDQRAALSPIINESSVYISNDSDTLYALDATTGMVRWRFNDPRVNSSPAVFLGMIYVGSNFGPRAMELSSGSDHNLYTTGISHAGVPAVVSSAVYTTAEGDIDAFHRTSGDDLWSYFTGNLGQPVKTPPTVTEHSIFAGFTDGVVAINRFGGTETWRLPTPDMIVSVVASDELLFAGCLDGSLYCIEASSGNIIWTFEAGDSIRSEPSVIDTSVYFGSDDGHVYALGTLEDTTPVLAEETVLLAAPSVTALERGPLTVGTELTLFDTREERDDVTWVEVQIDDTTGWIPLDAIDPVTLPPEGNIEYVYVP